MKEILDFLGMTEINFIYSITKIVVAGMVIFFTIMLLDIILKPLTITARKRILLSLIDKKPGEIAKVASKWLGFNRKQFRQNLGLDPALLGRTYGAMIKHGQDRNAYLIYKDPRLVFLSLELLEMSEMSEDWSNRFLEGMNEGYPVEADSLTGVFKRLQNIKLKT